MAFACGTQSAGLTVNGGSALNGGNLAVGFASVTVPASGSGTGSISVGQTGGGVTQAGACSIDPSTAQPFRDYTGSLVATITVQ